MKTLLPAIAVALVASCAHLGESRDQATAREVSEAFRQGRISEEKYIELRMKQTAELRDEVMEAN